MLVHEAKNMVCPFIQSVSKMESLHSIESPANINCICGDCMAWQFQYEHKKIVGYNEGSPEYSGTKISDTSEKTELGYCKRLGKC